MHVSASAFAPFSLQGPRGTALPLVCDSPHSGTTYPADFGFALAPEILRTGEDTHVHELWHTIPDIGGTLLAAEFPRAYIDPNREPDDLDQGLLDAPWPGPLNPSEKSRLGYGLIWKKSGGKDIYDRKLTVAEVQQRIARYHAPYHAALGQAIEAAHRTFGAVWHLNLHSMPADSYEVLEIKSPHKLADFVLGDRDGTTCDPELVNVVERTLRDRGHTVTRNDPFKGVALIARLGRPAERRHSLQIEIHRGLYMNETTFEKSQDFGSLQATLTHVSEAVANYIRSSL